MPHLRRLSELGEHKDLLQYAYVALCLVQDITQQFHLIVGQKWAAEVQVLQTVVLNQLKEHVVITKANILDPNTSATAKRKLTILGRGLSGQS